MRRGPRRARSAARAGRTGRAAGPTSKATSAASSGTAMESAARSCSRSAFASPSRRWPGALVGIGEGARPPTPGGRRGGRQAQHLPGGQAGGVVEHLAELGEAQLHEPVEALADPRLLGHEGHREAGRLAQLDPREGIAHRWRVTHGHLGEAPGVRRVRLGATQAALGEVSRRERVDEGHRDALPPQVRGERHPVVARGLHGHERHRVGLPVEPGIEGRNPARSWLTRRISRSARVSPSRQRATTCVRPPMSMPIVLIRAASLRGPPGVPARPGRRLLMGPITGQRRRIPITVHDQASGAGH